MKPKIELNEAEDYSTASVIHQGKSIAEWERLLKKDFDLTQDQILRMARAGVDLGRMLQGLDEAETDFDSPVFADEEFFFEDESKDLLESLSELDEDIKSNIASFAAGVATSQALGKPKDGKTEGQPANPNNLIGPAAMLMATASANRDATAASIMQKAFNRKQAASDITDAQLCLLALIFEAGENGIVWPEIKNALKKSGKTRLDLRREMRILINNGFIDEDFNLFTRNVYYITRRGKKILAQNGYDSAKMKALSSIVKQNIEDYDKENDVNINIHESARHIEDVVTIEDLISVLRRNAKLDDKVMFRVNKQEAMPFDINSRGGTAVIDIVPNAGRMNEDVELDLDVDSDGIHDDFLNVSDLERLGKQAYPHNATGWMTDSIAGIVDGKVVDFTDVKYTRPERYPSNGTFFLMDGTAASLEAYEKAKASMLSEEEKQDVNEGRNWRNGGYGGTGSSYSKLGSKAPRGEEISWFPVEVLDPKAKGKISPGWRCGPTNFPFKDIFFPNRKYKVGTMAMRNKYVKAGQFSGVVQIYIPSYFEIIKTNNVEGINVLKSLGIPLDLTFGMNPNDDYSNTYTK